MTAGSDLTEKALGVLRVIYAALFSSLVIYGVALSAVIKGHDGETASPMQLRLALGFVALSTTFAIPILRRVMFARVSGDARRAVTPSEADRTRALDTYRQVQILTWALCESIALDGFVLTFLTGDLRDYLGFAALSASCFVIYRPRRAELDQLVSGVTGPS